MKLTTAQKRKLQEHAAHHTQKHVDFMKKRMRAGDTFEQAHGKAKAKIGQ